MPSITWHRIGERKLNHNKTINHGTLYSRMGTPNNGNEANIKDGRPGQLLADFKFEKMVGVGARQIPRPGRTNSALIRSIIYGAHGRILLRGRLAC